MHQGGREGVTGPLFRSSRRTGPAFMFQNEPFQVFLVIFAQKMTKRRNSFRSTVALPVLLCDLG